MSFRALLLATIGTATAILAACAVIFLATDRHVAPAVFLPLHGTVAVFQNVHVQDVQRFQTMFPILTALPSTPDIVHIAIVQLPTGAYGWVLFPVEKNGDLHVSLPAKPGLFGFVTSGQPELTALLKEEKNRLSASAPYATLARHVGRVAWAFIDLQGVQTLSHDDRRIAALAGVDRFAGIVLDTRPRFIAYNEHLPTSVTLSPVILPSQPLEAVIAVNRPAVLWQALLQNATPTEKLVLETRAATAVQRFISSDVSLTYDLLPLLDRNMTLMIGAPIAGQTSFLLRGTASSRDLLAATILRMHQHAASMTSGSQVVNHTFDPKDGFSFRGLEATPGDMNIQQKNVAGWDVRITGSGASEGLSTATMGTQFLTSNNAALLSSVLESTSTLPVASVGVGRSVVAAGRTSAPWLNQLLSPPLSTGLLQALFPTLLTGNIQMDWSITRDGPLLTFQIDPAPGQTMQSSSIQAGSGVQRKL